MGEFIFQKRKERGGKKRKKEKLNKADLINAWTVLAYSRFVAAYAEILRGRVIWGYIGFPHPPPGLCSNGSGFHLQEMVDSSVSHLTEAIVSLDSYLLEARRHSIDLSNSVSGKWIHM